MSLVTQKDRIRIQFCNTAYLFTITEIEKFQDTFAFGSETNGFI